MPRWTEWTETGLARRESRGVVSGPLRTELLKGPVAVPACWVTGVGVWASLGLLSSSVNRMTGMVPSLLPVARTQEPVGQDGAALVAF